MSNRPFRLAHMSDFHVSRRPGPGEWTVKRALSFANQVFSRQFRHAEERVGLAVDRLLSSRPDVVLVTGDIVQNGLAGEFSAAEALLWPLAKNGIPVLTVAGNHEFYGAGRSGLSDPERFVFLKRKLRLGLEPDEFGVYRLGCAEFLELEQGMPTPPFFSHGRIRERGLARLSEEWRGNGGAGPRIAFGHYPVLGKGGRGIFFSRRLLGAEDLSRFLGRHGFCAYFCGHAHRRFSVDLSERCRQYAASSTSMDGVVSIYACSNGGVRLEEPEKDGGAPSPDSRG